MPKETFFNLPTEKKQKLLDALHKEFSEQPLATASIAHIIQYADIPRGSFYQYFDDLEDAYFYIFNQQIELAMVKYIWILEKSEGDIFQASIELYRIIIQEEDHFTFFKHAFLNMNYKIEKCLSGIFANEERFEHFEDIYKRLDLQSLKLEKKEEIFQLMKLISAITLHNITEKFSKELSLDEAVQTYQTQLAFIKSGVVQ
ncbi:TetR/AcrR family transcriptional regulator [Gracilibacillus caseinilyticus]|uniref:TetR/AcrR family transcriptional regulator n=1 Tax=Gracilibacillus caseinilyticus TaxID=2932256 RepID=A0ABY4F254_9BACI|nr:TetR/AcrR family transcriptional regulator [Gracilibacillus caseinilyticus]UOQ48506.1 TetR/AcrR family transcriptional regulator [Gracilibacillus caseinilyticus]